MRPTQNKRYFADDLFKCIFLNENILISKNYLRFIPKGSINNIPAFLSDNGLTLTRRQATVWNNDDYFADAYMRNSASMS